MPVIGVIPEDENLLSGFNKRTIVTLSKNRSSSKKEFFKIAARLVGMEYEYSFFDRVKRIFRKDKDVV